MHVPLDAHHVLFCFVRAVETRCEVQMSRMTRLPHRLWMHSGSDAKGMQCCHPNARRLRIHRQCLCNSHMIALQILSPFQCIVPLPTRASESCYTKCILLSFGRQQTVWFHPTSVKSRKPQRFARRTPSPRRQHLYDHLGHYSVFYTFAQKKDTYIHHTGRFWPASQFFATYQR